MVCVEPDTFCPSMSLCACVGESSLMGACAPYSAHRACSSRSWRRSPTRTAGSRASSSWSPRSATARAPTGSTSRASPTARSCWCRIRRTDETDSQWSSFANIMLSNAESSQDKIWPLKFLIHFSNELPDGIRQELLACCRVLSKTLRIRPILSIA